MTELRRSFRADFRQSARLGPDRPALIDERNGGVVTYDQLLALIERAGTFLEEADVDAERPVMTLLPNSVEALVLFLGAMFWGRGYAPLTAEATAEEVRRWASVVKPAVCIVTEQVPENITHAIQYLGIPVVRISLDSTFEWLPRPDRPPASGQDSGRLYLTTSGSTGDPQAIVFDGDRLWSSGKAFVRHQSFLDRDARFFNILPVSYLGGLFNLCFIPLATEGSVVVSEPFSGRTFLTFWQTVERFDVNTLWLVPSIVRGLIAIAQRTSRHTISATPKIRASFLGTAPIDLATKLRFEEIFRIPLLENFALSETTFFTAETLNNVHDRVEGSVGTLLPYAELKFVPVIDQDEPGAPRPLEIRVKSPFLVLGYLKPDGRVELPLDKDGFFPTQDLGHMHGSVLVVDGRIRDVIKKGGFLVSLREIEVLAESHEGVAEAVAVRQSHDFYGETYSLFVRLETDVAPSVVADIARFVHANVAKHKWPEGIEAVSDFPRTASGKVRKHVMVPASTGGWKS